jgi:solute carrier family 9 (sodium/hydrogen exchanger), member 3
MKQYVEFNISKKSNSTIEYVLKMAANIMETIIFMFMGLSTISDDLRWNTGFVIITIIACSLFRFIGVLIFANIANCRRLVKLEFTDMLIMSYGGIRGAVAFALALVLDENKIARKKEFVTATIFVVFFTVFFQVIKLIYPNKISINQKVIACNFVMKISLKSGIPTEHSNRLNL